MKRELTHTDTIQEAEDSDFTINDKTLNIFLGISRNYCGHGGSVRVGVTKHIEYTLITMVGTSIVATIYLELIQNRYMFRSFTVLHCSHQHCVQPVASDVEVVGYL